MVRTIAAVFLIGCAGAPSRGTETATLAPAGPVPDMAPYPIPDALSGYDLVARPDGVRIYGTFVDDHRTVLRFDLDAQGRAVRAAPVEVTRGPLVQMSSIAVTTVGEYDLVVICDADEDAGTRYTARWIDAAGASVESLDLGAYQPDEGMDSPCFIEMAPGGLAHAVVIHGRESLDCPRFTSDEEIETCPGYQGILLGLGSDPERVFHVGSGETTPRLAGSAAGWAWGLGPFPTRASIVLSYEGIPEQAQLLQSDELEGFLTTADTVVALVSSGADMPFGFAAFRGAAVLTGADANAYRELPALAGAHTLACTEGGITARVSGDALLIEAVAGEPLSAVPWGLFLDRPESRFSATAGRLYELDADEGTLTVHHCAGTEISATRLDWGAF